MSVLIKGMKMPKSCWDCRMVDVEFSFCHGVDSYDTGNHNTDKERPKWCPLVEIQPHGRLIDADALMHEFEKAQRTMEQHGQEYSFSFMSSGQEISTEWYCVEDMVENAPTIIPAEEG